MPSPQNNAAAAAVPTPLDVSDFLLSFSVFLAYFAVHSLFFRRQLF
jgi:hypothetical protein